jgi:hypothetical protein
MSRHSVKFAEYVVLYETYSKDEYDRSNRDIPSFKIQSNATSIGGMWTKQFNKIKNELEKIRLYEMYQAYSNSLMNKKIYNEN